MNNSRDIPIVLSGWSGVGTSVVSMHLALILKRNYIYFGKLFRDIGEFMGYDNEGISRVEIDELLEKHIGKLVDQYVDYLLINGEGFVLESDIAGFRLKKRQEFVSVFLYADKEIRMSRVLIDGRGEDAKEILEARDLSLQKMYQVLWGIDIFDFEQIKNSYWYTLDSSKLTVLQTIIEVWNLIRQFEFFGNEHENLLDINHYVDLFNQKGKDGLRTKLFEKGLLVSSKELAVQMKQVMPEEVNRLPSEIKLYFQV